MSDPYSYLTPYPFPVQTLPLADGSSIAHVDIGEGSETLMFVHGLSSSLMVWQRNLAELSKHYRCIAIDLPGYGRSPRARRKLDMAFLSAVVMEVLYRKGVKRAILVGHSMGGQISLTAALRYPHSVAGLILAAPAGFEKFTYIQKGMLINAFRPEVVARTRPSQIRKNAKMSLHTYETAADFMANDRLALMESSHFEAYCQTVSESVQAMAYGPVLDHLPHIWQNTLIIFGKQDPLIPNRLFSPFGSTKQVAEVGAKRIPHSQLILLDRCAHFVPFEQAATFNELAGRFANDTN